MIHVVRGLVRQDLILMQRYWLDYLSGLVVMYLIFLMIFLGLQTTSSFGVDVGSSTASLVVSYWIVLVTNQIFQNFSNYISSQAMVGTLEQLYLTPFGFGTVAFGKMVSQLLQTLGMTTPFLVVMMLTTGQRFHIDLVSMAPVVLASVAQAFGLGLVMAGLTIVHKRIGELGQLFSMLLIVFIAAPPELSPAVRFLPLNSVWRLLRAIMVDGMTLSQLPGDAVVLVSVQTVLLVWLGISVYRRCERLAMRKGSLGQY